MISLSAKKNGYCFDILLGYTLQPITPSLPAIFLYLEDYLVVLYRPVIGDLCLQLLLDVVLFIVDQNGDYGLSSFLVAVGNCA